MVSIFSTCWLIAGSVYVYGAAPTYDDPKLDSYCEYNAYMCVQKFYPVPERSEGTEVSKLAIRSDEITVLA